MDLVFDPKMKAQPICRLPDVVAPMFVEPKITLSEHQHFDRDWMSVMVNGKELNPPPDTEHIRFTESRITTTSHPKRHANEPGLKGFVKAGGRFLGLILYRAVYVGDPEERIDLDAAGMPMPYEEAETWRDREPLP